MGNNQKLIYRTINVICLCIMLPMMCLSCKDKKDEMIEYYKTQEHDSRLIGLWTSKNWPYPYIEFAASGYIHEYIRNNDGSWHKSECIIWHTTDNKVLNICPLYRRPITEYPPEDYKISNDTIFVAAEGKWYPEYIKYNGELK